MEEFAPKNKISAFIEVNINNLAAVPSIVFGLLGLALLLNVFDLPRSTPLVGGLVLSLMTLPTIIIASRASLRAVPPSIREAALGMGASPIQATFHHVAPLALPGILTGTIVGMAQALGETASIVDDWDGKHLLQMFLHLLLSLQRHCLCKFFFGLMHLNVHFWKKHLQQ